jgi:hypothetical protein
MSRLIKMYRLNVCNFFVYQVYLNKDGTLIWQKRSYETEKWKEVKKESRRTGMQSPRGKVCLENRKDISWTKTHWGTMETF